MTLWQRARLWWYLKGPGKRVIQKRIWKTLNEKCSMKRVIEEWLERKSNGL